MNAVTKTVAVDLLSRHGIPGLPTAVFGRPEDATAAMITAEFGSSTPLVLRTGTAGEERNLPRTIAANAAEAADWVTALDPSLQVVVQPYDDVLFSVEIASYDQYTLAELVAGVWELDSTFEPTALELSPRRCVLSSPDRAQHATFHDLARGRHQRLARISDWQIAAVMDWVRHNGAALSAMRSELDHPVGVKLHYAARHGLVAQNVRTALPTPAPARAVDGAQPRIPVVAAAEDVIDVVGGDGTVLLDVAIAREDHTDLARLMHRLKTAGVTAVQLRSGVLSHLAIALREEGFEVTSCHG